MNRLTIRGFPIDKIQSVARSHALFVLLLGASLFPSATLNAVEPEMIVLAPAIRNKCLAVLDAGLNSEEFWPAMHAAEALTLAGERTKVLAALNQRSAIDDQQRCGLAREAVRAGDRSKISVLLDILMKPGSNGHTHATESLFKVAEVGDGHALRLAMQEASELKLKLMAAAALARCGHPTALDVVRRYVADSNVDQRIVAAWILGQIGSPQDIQPLQEALAAESDALARAYVVNALACLGDAKAKQLLGENLHAELPAVRTYSAEFAGHSRATNLHAELIKLLDDDTLDVRLRAAQSLIVLSSPPELLGLPIAVTEHDLSRTVYSATAENPRYSEGSVAVLHDGSLLFATTEFVGGKADHASARLIARSSRDRGYAWSEPRVLQENTGQQNVMSVTLRRLLPGRFDGPLGMFYLVKNGPSDLQVWLRISEDEARAFGDPIRVTSGSGYHVMNNDRVAVLSNGRLICPVAWTDDVFKQGAGHFVSRCYFSDDQGRTWQKSADHVDQPRRGAMEPEVVELDGGNLLMILRTQLGRIATSLSADGGNHWSAPSALPVQSPESPATIRCIPATGDLLLIWNNTMSPGAGHGGKRTPLTTAISSDEGRTWHHYRNLEERPDEAYAYTSVAFHRDRLLLTYYVADDSSGRISSRFRSLPVRWLYALP